MPPTLDTISFLSDYGTSDEFVGVVKSVIRSIAPHTTVVDITHEIRPYDLKGGALTLARSVQYLCPGVVLAVVDPGVGTARRAVAIEVGDGQSYLVGPDNGLLASAVGMVGGATAAGDEDLAWAERILGAVGKVVRVDESLLDAVTGLSGSGPAYVFLVVEALIEGGVLAGLPRPVATTLATQTLLGAARLLDESTEGPEALRAAVTSPGGTTAAGLRALEAGAVRASFLDAIMAATERSRELGA